MSCNQYSRPHLVESDFVVFVVAVVGLVEECMVYLGQQHFGRKEQAAVVVAEGWTI